MVSTLSVGNFYYSGKAATNFGHSIPPDISHTKNAARTGGPVEGYPCRNPHLQLKVLVHTISQLSIVTPHG